MSPKSFLNLQIPGNKYKITAEFVILNIKKILKHLAKKPNVL